MNLLNSLLIAQENVFPTMPSDTGVPDPGVTVAAGFAVIGVIMIISLIISLALALPVIVGMWKVFTKAGKPGWAAIIPIYNVIVLLEVVGKPVWWIALLLIPFVNVVISILLNLALAERFGKDGLYAVGLIFLPFIFLPMLGFGSSTYQPAPAEQG